MLKVNATAYFLESYSYQSKPDKDSKEPEVTRYAVSFLCYDEEEKRTDVIRSFLDEPPIDRELNFMDKCEIVVSVSAADKDNKRRLSFEKFVKLLEPSKIVKAV